LTDFISALANLAQTPESSPIIVGHVHSYDYSEGLDDQRRLRVKYLAPDGAAVVSPLLYRVTSSLTADPPVPEVGALVIGLWTALDRSAGVYLGTVQNQPLVTNFDSTQDKTEVVPGVLTLRARHIRIIAEDGLELFGNITQPNYSSLKIGDEPTSDRASDIQFRDGFGCEIAVREIFNAVLLDELPELDA
jgi:hypothetical protein